MQPFHLFVRKDQPASLQMFKDIVLYAMDHLGLIVVREIHLSSDCFQVQLDTFEIVVGKKMAVKKLSRGREVI